MNSSITPEEIRRYDRHLSLPGVGLEGQLRLKNSRVLIVGAGGLGSPSALYLAAAGVGTVGLVDHDLVDASNLQRQLLHGTRDVGRSKLESARDRLHDVNPHVVVALHDTWLSSQNALEIVGQYDLVLDGTDNFATRYLINDACVLLGKPNVHGAIFRFDGQASVFATDTGPCYRCLYPEPPPPGLVPNCAEGGVLGVLPGLIGTIQAVEAIKLIVGLGETLAGRLLLVDTLSMEFRTVRVERDPDCPACGTRTITQLIDYNKFCGTPALSDVPTADDVREITPTELAARLARHDVLALVDVREPHETAASSIPGAKFIPLGTLGDAIASLDRTRDIVLICRRGTRSVDAARQLQAAGFTRVESVAGGMLRWSDETSVPIASS